ncbi:unnamed protein product, partial [Mesorhabditis belari]|uniref:Uncharacterized protein n=1 Tax=Mesorhabditis belari TaxID=2138241 RepID=A0AAF3FCA0_9BILA
MRSSPCTVCSSLRGTSLFYGGLVCCGCKVFFLRSVTAKARYRCANGGACLRDSPAGSAAWVKCRACRFQKCLDSNMNPEAVGVVKGQRLAKASGQAQPPPLPQAFEEVSNPPSIAPYSPPLKKTKLTGSDQWNDHSPSSYLHRRPPSPPLSPSSTTSTVSASHSPVLLDISEPSTSNYQAVVPYFEAKNFPMAPSAIGFTLFAPMDSGMRFAESSPWDSLSDILSRLRILERYCDVSDVPAGPSSYVNIDVPLGEALRNPLALCQRTPVGFSVKNEVTQTVFHNFPSLFCRFALHYIDWVAGLAELRQLDEKDKLSLITSQMCVSELVVLVYHSWISKSPGFVFPGGTHFVDSHRPAQNDIDEFCQLVSRYVHNDIFPDLESLQLTSDEFVILKTIVFFTSTCVLSDYGAMVVRKARAKYEQVLIQLIAEKNPHLTEIDRQLRVYRIIALNRHFVILAMKDNIFLSRLCTLNIGNMQGSLLFDFYLKQY